MASRIAGLFALLAVTGTAQTGPGYIVNSGIGGGVRVQNVDGSSRYHLATGAQRQNDGANATFPSVSADGQKIAFLRNDKYLFWDLSWPADQNRLHVFLMNADGSGLRQVTGAYFFNNDWQNDDQPVLSPDGTKVAFLRQSCSALSWTSCWPVWMIFVVNSDGSGLRQVTQPVYDSGCSVETLTWGVDNRTLYFTAGGNCGFNGAVTPAWHKGLFSVRDDGSAANLLWSRGVCGSASGTALALSPDGRRLALGFFGCGERWVRQMDAVSGALLNEFGDSVLLANPAAAGTMDAFIGGPGALQYSPDSTQLAYLASYGYLYPGCTGGGVHVVNVDGTNPHNLFYEPGACWSYYGSNKFWWARGAALPLPASLTAAPADTCATPGVPVPIFSELKSAAGRVLSRSAQSYSAADTRVAQVDSFGRIWAEPNAFNSSTSVSVNNAGLSAPVTVHNLPTCSCALDLSSQVAVNRSGFTYDPRSGHFFQSVTLRNNGANIAGPVVLALDTISANATLIGAAGTTSCTYRQGKPYVQVAAGDLRPGASLSVKLEFANPSRTGIIYTTRVLAGAGTL